MGMPGHVLATFVVEDDVLANSGLFGQVCDDLGHRLESVFVGSCHSFIINY